MARSGSNCSCILKRALSCEPPRPNSADHRNGYLGALVAVRHVQAAAGDLRCVTLARFHSWRSCRARSVSRTMSALVLALGPPTLALNCNHLAESLEACAGHFLRAPLHPRATGDVARPRRSRRCV